MIINKYDCFYFDSNNNKINLCYILNIVIIEKRYTI